MDDLGQQAMSDAPRVAAFNWKRIVGYALGIVVVSPIQYLFFVPSVALLAAALAIAGWLRASKNAGILKAGSR